MLREYRTAHGRWTQPDPAGLGVVDPTNPQTWNRYAYVLNNPMAMVDLLGDDGCYDGQGNQIFATISATCGDSGGQWLDGDVSVVNGQVYVPLELTGANMGPSGASTYAKNVSAGSFQDLFGYLFQGGSPPSGGQVTFTINWTFAWVPGGGGDGGTYDARTNALAQAINATGVQTLQKPCTIGLIVAIPAGGAALVTTSPVGAVATLEMWGVPATSGLSWLYAQNPASVAVWAGKAAGTVGRAIHSGCGW